MMLLVVLLGEALADTITLDSGTALEGTLTHYEIRGSCNIHVDSGGLSGADVVLPCSQVIRMERPAVAQSDPTTLDGSVIVVPEEQAPVEEIAAPLIELAPMAVAEEFSDADAGAEPEAAPQEPLPPAPAPEEETPVAAVSPEEPVPAASPEEPVPATSPEEPAATKELEQEKAEAAPEKPEKSGPPRWVC
jgi:hypothetical protein